MTRVLILEDDTLLASSLARALQARAFSVAVASTIADATRLTDCDLVLCDLSLPDGDGLDFIRTLGRERPGLPIIALTARTEESDVIAGLVSGAVGYITKPFRLAELLARVDAQLRLVKAATNPVISTIKVGELHIDIEARNVHISGVDIDLRHKEFDLLVCLARGAGKVIRRDLLMSEVWGQNWVGPTKTLDVHVNAIRRKLGEQPGGSSRISAVRNVGYRLEAR